MFYCILFSFSLHFHFFLLTKSSEHDKTMSDQILLEDLLSSTDINFRPIFKKAAQNGHFSIMHKLFDRGLIHYNDAASTAAVIGYVELIDKILRNWDLHVKNHFHYYVPLTRMLETIIANACTHNRMNIIKYLFDQNTSFMTYYSQDRSLLEEVQYVKPDLTLGLKQSTTLQLAQYFVSKGATNFHDCLLQASIIGDLDMLIYSWSMFQSRPPSQKIDTKLLFDECFANMIFKNNMPLFRYFSSCCYDLSMALKYSLAENIHIKWCHFLVQAINQNPDRFQITRWKHGYINTRTVLNCGLHHDIIKKIVDPKILYIYMQRQRIKCEALRKQFALVIPNDVFSLLKPFLRYDKLPSSSQYP